MALLPVQPTLLAAQEQSSGQPGEIMDATWFALLDRAVAAG
jgi:hypothetical protein